MDTRRVVEIVMSTIVGSLDLAQGIAEYAAKHGRWQMNHLGAFMPQVLAGARMRPPDGILCHCNPGEETPYLASRLPVVTFFGDLPHQILPTVLLGEYEIGRIGALHLIEQGFQNLAFCGTSFAFSRERERGFRETLSAAGRSEPFLIAGSGTGGRPTFMELVSGELLRDWIRDLPLPVGVMSATDQYGVAVIEAGLEMGRQVPEDLAVIGVDDNVLICEFAPVKLSSVNTNLHGVGYAAAAMLDGLMRGEPKPPRPAVVPPRGVTVRASTNVMAFEDSDVRDALVFIRHNATRGITVEDVADATAVSLNTLRRRFQQLLRCRVGDEIRRVRLEAARDLLLQTDLPAQEVARRSGLGSTVYLNQSFKKRYGLAPGQYRLYHRRQVRGTPG